MADGTPLGGRTVTTMLAGVPGEPFVRTWE